MLTMWLRDWSRLIGLEHLRYGARLVEYDTRTDTMMWGLLLARHVGWTTMAKTKAKAMARYLDGLHHDTLQ
jgi:hypothetical protein